VILHPGPAAADADSIIYRHGRRNVRLHFGGILPIVCPTADDSQFSGLAVFAGSLEEAKRDHRCRPRRRSRMPTYEIHPVRSS
jgi:hypothetical protein